MQTNQTPSQVAIANAEQIANIVRDYGLPMAVQLEINECVQQVARASAEQALIESVNKALAFRATPKIAVLPNKAIAGNLTFERVGPPFTFHAEDPDVIQHEGKFFINGGRPGFNTMVNNSIGYASQREAEDIIRSYVKR